MNLNNKSRLPEEEKQVEKRKKLKGSIGGV